MVLEYLRFLVSLTMINLYNPKPNYTDYSTSHFAAAVDDDIFEAESAICF